MGVLAPYRVVHGWPILPEGYVLGQVCGVGVDSHEHVFVFHRADHGGEKPNAPIDAPVVMCFDGVTGKLLDSWGANMFRVPHGLRVDDRDNVWITDLDLHQVFKFSHDGTLRMTLGVAGTPGWDHLHFNKPTDVAVGRDGFYVSDGYGNRRVAKFSHDGKFLFEWGKAGDKPGEFQEVHNLVLDREGRVYVTDRINRRVQVFAGDGQFIAEWKSEALGCPWALAYGADDSLYLVDGGDMSPRLPARARISRLDRDGNILEHWSSFGNYDGQLFWGHDIAVGKSGSVYVGEVNHGMRVQKFSRSEQEYLFLSRQK